MGVRLKPCPFCGGEVIEYIGYGGMRRFWCKKCDAVVSFDNDYCNRNPESTYEYWNKRTEVDIVRCGECKWWDKDGESPYGYCHAEKHCHFSNNWEISIYRKYKADHYCSDGERRMK